MSTKRERIAIVAAGVVTPIGQDLDTFWSGLLTGVDGTSAVERFPVGDLRVGRGGEIKKLTLHACEGGVRVYFLLARQMVELPCCREKRG